MSEAGLKLSGRKGVAFSAGFWLVVAGLLSARVALYEEITAARVASFVSTHVASLSAIMMR